MYWLTLRYSSTVVLLLPEKRYGLVFFSAILAVFIIMFDSNLMPERWSFVLKLKNRQACKKIIEHQEKLLLVLISAPNRDAASTVAKGV